MSPIWGPACTGLRRALLCIFFLLGVCSCLRQYFLVTQQMTWLEAQTYCKDEYTDLATVDNIDDMDQMIADAGSFTGTVWIGLYDVWWKWNWSAPGGFEPVSYTTNWNNNGPFDSRNLWEMCGAQMGDTWFDIHCNTSLPFVCYSNQSSTMIFAFVNEAETWYNAQAYCRQKYTDLACAFSPKDKDGIKSVIKGPSTAFIGLYRPTWMWWSDGAVHIFDYWIQGRPLGRTGDCAASLIDAANVGKLMEFDCRTRFYFMCYGPPQEPPQMKYIRRIKVTAQKSTADLNDPAVTNAILTQMEQKLREAGITASLNITWITQPDQKTFYKENN